MPSCARHRLRRRPVVAGQHDDPHPLRLQAGERFGRRRLDRVGDGEERRRPAVDADEDRRRAVLPQLVGLRGERSHVDALLGQERRIAEHDALPSTLPSAPLPVGESNSSTGAVAMPALLGRGDDRRGERVLAGPLDAGGQAQQFGLA